MDRTERTALASMGINAGLVLLKGGLAAASGSLALVADALNSGSDIASSGLVWAGARISRREGHTRLALIENIVGLLIAGLILWAAASIFRRVGGIAASQVTRLPLAIGGSFLAALVSYFSAQYKLSVGRQVGSQSLIADGYDSWTDTLATGAVIVGLMGQAIGVRLDSIAAAIVALFIIQTGVIVLVSSIRGLRSHSVMGAAPAGRLATSRVFLAVAAGMERLGLSALSRRFGAVLREPRGRRRLAGGAACVAVAVWALSGVYFVGPGRVGVVTRWGRALAGDALPGAHMKAPWPIDRVARVDLTGVRRIEIGFRTREAPAGAPDAAAEDAGGFYATLWESRHAAGTYEKMPEEALRLTGDENMVDVNVVVLYRVTDARAYLYRIAGITDFVLLNAESMLAELAAGLTLDGLLTLHREDLELEMARVLRSYLEENPAGVEIVGVRLQDMHPPLEVVSSFRDVASAREDKSTMINEAHAYANEVVPQARGDAERRVREAEGYRRERVERARGDADRIIAMARAYKEGPEVTRTRLYIETMEEILAGIEKFIVSANVELRGYDIRVFDKDVGAEAAVIED